MREVTVDDVMAKKPCNEYPREQVEALWGSRESLTLTEVLDLDIPAKDRVWAVTRFLSKEEKRYFARWCALQVIHLWNCPDVVKQYLETGDEGLRDAAHAAALNATHAAALNAARSAAWNAVRDAALDAAWNAALAAVRDAAWNAAWSVGGAAWDVAWGEEHQKQVEKLKEIVRCAG